MEGVWIDKILNLHWLNVMYLRALQFTETLMYDKIKFPNTFNIITQMLKAALNSQT